MGDVSRAAVRFWSSSLAAALGIAAAAALLLPEALGLRGWLLTVWTAGVMWILFGAAALLGTGGIGVREVLEAGSTPRALDADRRHRAFGGEGIYRDAGWWAVVTGGILVGLYFAVWLILG